MSASSVVTLTYVKIENYNPPLAHSSVPQKRQDNVGRHLCIPRKYLGGKLLASPVYFHINACWQSDRQSHFAESLSSNLTLNLYVGSLTRGAFEWVLTY